MCGHVGNENPRLQFFMFLEWRAEAEDGDGGGLVSLRSRHCETLFFSGCFGEKYNLYVRAIVRGNELPRLERIREN